jgi:serine/threonine-protein kinase ATR
LHDSENFLAEELKQEWALFAKTFRQTNPADEERPAKRRRTLPENAGDENPDAYGELKMILNGSSSESPVLDLSDLHNIVQ